MKVYQNDCFIKLQKRDIPSERPYQKQDPLITYGLCTYEQLHEQVVGRARGMVSGLEGLLERKLVVRILKDS